MELLELRVRRALDQLRERGWAVGPPAARDEWRRVLRLQARRAGLRIRTGEAHALGPDVGGAVHPWAVTVVGYEVLRAHMGRLGLEAFGSVLVSASAGGGDARAGR